MPHDEKPTESEIAQARDLLDLIRERRDAGRSLEWDARNERIALEVLADVANADGTAN